MIKSGKHIKQLVEEAGEDLERVPVCEAIASHGDPSIVIVDIRDVRERRRDGFIPGSFHTPRGMLEFWIAPDSPYHKEIFTEDKKFIFYCASSWRSALAGQTAKMMGLLNVAHIDGGFTAWQKAGGPIEKITS